MTNARFKIITHSIKVHDDEKSYTEYGNLDKRLLINTVNGLLRDPKSVIIVSCVSFVTKWSNQMNSKVTKTLFSKWTILTRNIVIYTCKKVSGVNKLTCLSMITRSFFIILETIKWKHNAASYHILVSRNCLTSSM